VIEAKREFIQVVRQMPRCHFMLEVLNHRLHLGSTSIPRYRGVQKLRIRLRANAIEPFSTSACGWLWIRQELHGFLN
jgi:hypothetical protein